MHKQDAETLRNLVKHYNLSNGDLSKNEYVASLIRDLTKTLNKLKKMPVLQIKPTNIGLVMLMCCTKCGKTFTFVNKPNHPCGLDNVELIVMVNEKVGLTGIEAVQVKESLVCHGQRMMKSIDIDKTTVWKCQVCSHTYVESE